jgi:acetaldehyde dehydrogenase/alcohol dehydrogenase
MMSAPKSLTCASGIDVMTHAIEAYVSIMASDYTDALALKAIKLVFDYLPRAYRDGSDVEARDHMANASCLAGMAFANAFLGLNHSMAHKLGAYHHLPHGIANAVLLTEVMKYNSAEAPTKMGTFPQYAYPHALARYAEIGRFLGLTGRDDQAVFEKLLDKLEQLKADIEIKGSIREYGISEEDFLATLDEMTEQAFNDQCTGANPRYPLMSEMKEIYLTCYYGNGAGDDGAATDDGAAADDSKAGAAKKDGKAGSGAKTKSEGR